MLTSWAQAAWKTAGAVYSAYVLRGKQRRSSEDRHVQERTLKSSNLVCWKVLVEYKIDALIRTEYFRSRSVNARNVVAQTLADVKVTLQGKRVVGPAGNRVQQLCRRKRPSIVMPHWAGGPSRSLSTRVLVFASPRFFGGGLGRALLPARPVMHRVQPRHSQSPEPA